MGFVWLIIDFDTFTYPFFDHPGYALTVVIFILISAMLLFLMISHFLRSPVNWRNLNVISVENMNKEILTYIFTYVIVFLKFPEERQIVITAFLLVFIGIIYIRSDLIGVNPILSLFGFHITKVEWQDDVWLSSQTALVISKQDYYKIKTLKRVDALQLHNEMHLLKEVKK